MVVETIIATKVLLAMKGAVVVAAHNGVTAHLPYNFSSMAFSVGLVPALEALVASLAAYGAMAGVVTALQSLISALKEEDKDPAKILVQTTDLARSVASLA